MTFAPVTWNWRWLFLIFVAAACLPTLHGCSTTQPVYVRELPPIPPELAARPEKLKPIPRLTRTSPNSSER